MKSVNMLLCYYFVIVLLELSTIHLGRPQNVCDLVHLTVFMKILVRIKFLVLIFNELMGSNSSAAKPDLIFQVGLSFFIRSGFLGLVGLKPTTRNNLN